MSLSSKTSSFSSSGSCSSSIFRGDGEDLLEALLSSCSAHKSNATHHGFGRELQPFFGEGESLAPDQVRGPTKSQRGIRERRAADEPAAELRVTTTCNNPSFLARACISSPAQTFNQRSMSPSSSLGSSPKSTTSSGCPAFFSSPKPDSLPMPSMGFLSRAGCAAPPACAVHGTAQCNTGANDVLYLNGFAIPMRA